MRSTAPSAEQQLLLSHLPMAAAARGTAGLVLLTCLSLAACAIARGEGRAVVQRAAVSRPWPPPAPTPVPPAAARQRRPTAAPPAASCCLQKNPASHQKLAPRQSLANLMAVGAHHLALKPKPPPGKPGHAAAAAATLHPPPPVLGAPPLPLQQQQPPLTPRPHRCVVNAAGACPKHARGVCWT